MDWVRHKCVPIGVLRQNLVDIWADLEGPQLASNQVRLVLDRPELVITNSVHSGINNMKWVRLGLNVSS